MKFENFEQPEIRIKREGETTPPDTQVLSEEVIQSNMSPEKQTHQNIWVEKIHEMRNLDRQIEQGEDLFTSQDIERRQKLAQTLPMENVIASYPEGEFDIENYNGEFTEEKVESFLNQFGSSRNN